MSKAPYIELDERARTIFREVVENFMLYGDPVGSRTLERSGQLGVSAATIRNVMADLEEMGLLYAPHISAGRLPTQQGLRYFIDGVLELSDLPPQQRQAIEKNISNEDHNGSIDTLLDQVSTTLSGLSSCAGLVVAPKIDKLIKQIEFVQIDTNQAFVVIVSEDGEVENRLFSLPPDITKADLEKAGNYLSQYLGGRTVQTMRAEILKDIKMREAQLGALTTKIIEAGLATETPDGKLIVRGWSNLLDEQAAQDLDLIREMMNQLEQKEIVSQLLEKTGQAEGVKIFIGSENDVLRTTGHSMILAPYTNGLDNQVVGTIGVIGPTRLNYAQIIPSVNVLADILSQKLRMIGEQRFAPSPE